MNCTYIMHTDDISDDGVPVTITLFHSPSIHIRVHKRAPTFPLCLCQKIKSAHNGHTQHTFRFCRHDRRQAAKLWLAYKEFPNPDTVDCFMSIRSALMAIAVSCILLLETVGSVFHHSNCSLCLSDSLRATRDIGNHIARVCIDRNTRLSVSNDSTKDLRH